MSEPITFFLKPFEATAATAELAIAVTATQEQETLSLSYVLKGNLDNVTIPARSQPEARKNRLWEQTCFEFFLGEGTHRSLSAPYWEFNLSPSGDWNVFALTGYRQGLKEETAFTTLPCYIGSLTKALYLDISVNIGRIIDVSQPLRLGLSAVVLIGGKESFWAIAHPAAEADFHHPDSFILNPFKA